MQIQNLQPHLSNLESTKKTKTEEKFLKNEDKNPKQKQNRPGHSLWWSSPADLGPNYVFGVNPFPLFPPSFLAIGSSSTSELGLDPLPISDP